VAVDALPASRAAGRSLRGVGERSRGAEARGSGFGQTETRKMAIVRKGGTIQRPVGEDISPAIALATSALAFGAAGVDRAAAGRIFCLAGRACFR
jgi:hypothetical protein